MHVQEGVNDSSLRLDATLQCYGRSDGCTDLPEHHESREFPCVMGMQPFFCNKLCWSWASEVHILAYV